MRPADAASAYDSCSPHVGQHKHARARAEEAHEKASFEYSPSIRSHVASTSWFERER